MKDQRSASIACTVSGIVQGHEVEAKATAVAGADGITISWPPAASWHLGYEGIDGVLARNESVTLYLRDDDVLELSLTEGGYAHAHAFVQSAVENACVVPELMRRRSDLTLEFHPSNPTTKAATNAAPNPTSNVAYDRWMKPWLAVRTELAGVSDPERQVMLLNAERSAKLIAEAITSLTSMMVTEDVREQRALYALLEDEARNAGVFESLDRVALVGSTVVAAGMDTRLHNWRLWISAVRQAFDAAEEAWSGLNAILTTSGLA